MPHEATNSVPPVAAWVQVVAAAVGGCLAGAATFGGDLLTPMGNAIVTALATALGALVVHLFRYPRTPAAIGVLACVLGAGVAVNYTREEPPPGVAAFTGGCEPFTVFAQDRWRPRGAAVREAPLPKSPKIAAFSGNALVTVDGWVRTQPPYPHNPEPFDNEYWFHLADDSGWVAFAGVRADSTPFDPTGLDQNGGRPAPLDSECSGVVRYRNHEES